LPKPDMVFSWCVAYQYAAVAASPRKLLCKAAAARGFCSFDKTKLS
jgi:hypothetical protein